jgi:hypothetical protein
VVLNPTCSTLHLTGIGRARRALISSFARRVAAVRLTPQ